MVRRPRARTQSSRRRTAPLLFSLFVAGCGASAPEYQAYEGPPAYDNRRPALSPDGQSFGYVSNSLSDTISVVDLDGWAVAGSAPVGRNPVDIDGPHHLTIDRERGLLYVALSYPQPTLSYGPHAGHGTSDQTGYAQALALDDLRPLGELAIDRNPGDIVLSPNGSQLAVTHYDLTLAQASSELEARRAALALIEPAADLAAGSATIRRTPICIAPHAAAWTADSSRLFVACTGEDSVAVVDPGPLEVLERVPVAETVGEPGAPSHEPYALGLSPDATLLAVSNIGSNSVTLFEVGPSLVRRSLTPVGGRAYFPAWLAADRLLVPRQDPDGAVLLDAASGALLLDTTYPGSECIKPHEAVATPSGRVFLVCEGDHMAPGSLAELNPETLAIIGTLEVGVFPDRMVVLEP